MLNLMIKLTLAWVDSAYSDSEAVVYTVTPLGAVFVNANSISHFSESGDGPFTTLYTNREDGFYVIEPPSVILAKIEEARRELV